LAMEIDGAAGGIGIVSYRNSNLGGNIELVHARGTQASPQEINLNDDAGNIYMSGYKADGTVKIIGNIAAQYTGTISGKMKGAIVFRVGETPDEIARFTYTNNNSSLNPSPVTAANSSALSIGFSSAALSTSSVAAALQVNGPVGIGT